MAVNAYSRGPVAPQFTSNYLSQHVDAPFEAINMALQTRQQEYNHWRDGQQTLHEGLMGIQAATQADADYLKKAQKDYNTQLEQYSQGDLTRPEVQRGLTNLATTIAGDKTLQGIQATHARVGELQAQYKALEKEGKGYTPQAQLMAQALSQYDSGGGAAAGQSFQGEDFQPALDHVTEAQKYFKAINPNDMESIRSISTKDGSLAYKIGQAGINAGQVYGAYAAGAGDWLASPYGKQVAQQALVKGATQEQAANYALKYLLNQGRNMIYSKTSTNADGVINKMTDWNRDDRKTKVKEDKETATSNFVLPDAKTTHTYEGKFDEKGNIKGDGTFDMGRASFHLAGGDLAGAWHEISNSNLTPEEKTKWEPVIKGTAHANEKIEAENKVRIKQGKTPLPLLTPQQFTENFTGLTKNTNSEIQRWDSGKQMDDATKALADGEGSGLFGSANVRLLGADNNSQTMSGAEAFKKLTGNKFTPEALKEVGNIRIVGPRQVTEEGMEQPATIGGQPVMIQYKSGKELESPTLHTLQESLEYNQKLVVKKGYHVFETYDPTKGKVVKVKGSVSPLTGLPTYERVH